MISPALNILADATVVSSAGIALTLLLRKPFRTLFGPGLAYVVWLLVPTSLLVLLLPAPSIGSKAVLAITLSVSSFTSRVLTSPVVAMPSSSGPDWRWWLLCTWGIGAVLFCWRLMRQQRRFIACLGALTGGNEGVFRAADSNSGPVVVGVLRPKIVVPGDFASRYAQQEQELILAHERMHVRRGDLVTNATCALARCIFWFNPLIHVAGRLMRFDQELACDADVMRNHPHSRKPYASAMLRTQLAGAALPVGCYWPATHPLKERIMVLKQPPARGLRRIIGQMLVGTCVCLVGYGTWAVQPAGASGDGTRVTYADSEIRISSDTVQASGNGVRYTGHVVLEIVGGQGGVLPDHNLSFSADRAETSHPGNTLNLRGHVSIKTLLFKADADEGHFAAAASASRPGQVLLEGSVRIEVAGRILKTERAWMSAKRTFEMDEAELLQNP